MVVADNDFEDGLLDTWTRHADPEDSDDESEDFTMPLPVSLYKQHMQYANRKNQNLSYEDVAHIWQM